MSDIIKINGTQSENIVKIDGVNKNSIVKVSGRTIAQSASKWIIGAGNGQIWRSTIPDAGYSDETNSGNWAQVADIGADQSKALAIGEDGSGNKRWAVHRTVSGQEVAYVNDGSEVADPTSSQGSWTKVALANAHTSANGGPSLAYGNGIWLGVGDDIGADDEILFGSSNGGSSWSTIAASPDINDAGRVICYKSGDTWLFTVQDFIFKCTSNPTNAGSWSQVRQLEASAARDIMCMAYDGTGKWVCIDIQGYAYSSNDDWSSVDSSGPNGTRIDSGFIPHAVIYCKGTINQWVAVGQNGHIWTSPDGGGNTGGGSPSITGWTKRTTPGTSDLRSVATDDKTIVAVGTGGAVYVSQDGSTWKNTAQNVSVATGFWSVSSDLIGAGLR